MSRTYNLSPDTWALWGSHEVDLYKVYADQWSDIRSRFIAIKALYPEQRDDIEETYKGMNNLRVEVGLLMEQVRENRDFEKLRLRAELTHRTVRDLVNKLMDAVGT